MKTMRVCTKCGEAKELEEFYRSASDKYGRSSRCKKCAQALLREWKRANQEKVRAKNRIYRRSEKGRESSRRSRLRNIDKIRAQDKRYREINKDKIAAYTKRWYRDNIDRVSAMAAMRRLNKQIIKKDRLKNRERSYLWYREATVALMVVRELSGVRPDRRLTGITSAEKKEYMKKYREANRDKLIEYNKNKYALHKDQIKAEARSRYDQLKAAKIAIKSLLTEEE